MHGLRDEAQVLSLDFAGLKEKIQKCPAVTFQIAIAGNKSGYAALILNRDLHEFPIPQKRVHAGIVFCRLVGGRGWGCILGAPEHADQQHDRDHRLPEHVRIKTWKSENLNIGLFIGQKMYLQNYLHAQNGPLFHKVRVGRSVGAGYNSNFIGCTAHSMKSTSGLLESTIEPASKAMPGLSFLVTLPGWHTVFFRNLRDLFRPSRQSPLPSYRAGSFWPDVFVPSYLPWKRFVQSSICHVALIAALWGSARLWPQRPPVFENTVFNRAEVIYYSPSEYLPALDTGGKRTRLPQRGEPEYASQPIISVPPEADNRNQTIVTPSELKLNHDLPLPNIVAWSQSPVQPAVPLASTMASANLRSPGLVSTVVAPVPETMPMSNQHSSTFSQAVVAPAPEINAEHSIRTLQVPQTAIIEPTAKVDAPSARKLGDINIGRAEVVAPAPELPMAEQHVSSVRAQAVLGGTGPDAVAPIPSIPSNSSSDRGGRLIALGIHPAAMRAPMEIPAGNRRGTFAATPAGKTGAAGTPDNSASADRSSQTGSGAGQAATGVPTGLLVGTAPSPAPTSTVAGQGKTNGMGNGAAANGNTEASRIIADATPPRVSTTPPRSASEVLGDKATDVDHWIFGDRKFYSMSLNMPNLNSAGGSWVIRFAELNGNESKGELTAPVATQKVDPAYPLELMRRNVQGTVTLYAVIRSDGSVSDVRILRSVDDRLDQYARAALAHWHFRPATRNGNAVDLEAVVVIPFRPVRGKSTF